VVVKKSVKLSVVRGLKQRGFGKPERAKLVKKAPELVGFLSSFVPKNPQERELGARVLDLASDDAIMRAKAANKLGQLNDSRAIEPLLSALKDTVFDVRTQAAFALGSLKDLRAVNPLLELLKSGEAKPRSIAATVLGAFKLPEVAKALIEAAKDKDARVRQTVAKSLGSFQEYPPAIKALELLLRDPDDFVAAQAAYSLRPKKK
jgi:HEAT repeat protein